MRTAVCVLDETSGKLALSDAFSLWANMPRKRVIDGLEAISGKPCALDDAQHATMASSGAFVLDKAALSCVCSFHLGRLRSLVLYPQGGSAAEQRALLLAIIGAQDPCPDPAPPALLRYTFGTVWISTDPRSGNASLRITYTGKE